MRELLCVIISWNRPEFLRRTLKSLFSQIDEIDADVVVVDNGSDEATCKIIEEDERIGKRIFLGSYYGINRALEAGLPDDVTRVFQNILISDADMQYRCPLGPILRVFHARPKIGAVSLQHSPEHPSMESFHITDIAGC